MRHVGLEVRTPWSTKRRRNHDLMVRARAYARGRWRWWAFSAHWPDREDARGGRLFSLTLEAKSWLTDSSMRGNLRHKAFARVTLRAGLGGVPDTGSRCPVMNSKGKRCTWERGHIPMQVTWRNPHRPVSEYPHSWACPPLHQATVTQEPRRPPASYRGGGVMRVRA